MQLEPALPVCIASPSRCDLLFVYWRTVWKPVSAASQFGWIPPIPHSASAESYADRLKNLGVWKKKMHKYLTPQSSASSMCLLCLLLFCSNSFTFLTTCWQFFFILSPFLLFLLAFLIGFTFKLTEHLVLVQSRLLLCTKIDLLPFFLSHTNCTVYPISKCDFVWNLQGSECFRLILIFS